MIGRYRASKEKSRSRFYILLSIIFVIVLFKWGIPYFVNIIAGSGAPRQETQNDTIPPQTPILSALPDATNSSSLVIEGYTEPNAALDILINDSINVTDKAKDDGSFTSVAKLAAGSNRVQVRAADQAGNQSVSEVKIVNYDSTPIDLTITSPKDGTEYFGKDNQVIDIKGIASKANSQIVINNSFVVVNNDGSFDHKYQLANGNNDLKIVASDDAGNTTEKTISIVYTP